jgi:hypothetical protein
MGPLRAVDVRNIVTDLKSANVPKFEDGTYHSFVHPIQAQQLRAETGLAAWRDPAVYKDTNDNVFTGEIGIFEGVKFFETTEVAGAGSGTISGYFMGRDFCGKAVGRDLRIGTGKTLKGPHDTILVVYWDSLLGYKIIRRESGRIIETNNTQK